MPVASLTMADFFSLQGLWANGWAGLTQAGARLPAVATSLGATFVLRIGRFAWFLAASEAWRPPGDVSAEQRRNVI